VVIRIEKRGLIRDMKITKNTVMLGIATIAVLVVAMLGVAKGTKHESTTTKHESTTTKHVAASLSAAKLPSSSQSIASSQSTSSQADDVSASSATSVTTATATNDAKPTDADQSYADAVALATREARQTVTSDRYRFVGPKGGRNTDKEIKIGFQKISNNQDSAQGYAFLVYDRAGKLLRREGF
jgi:cytoskeletal protein RodZ